MKIFVILHIVIVAFVLGGVGEVFCEPADSANTDSQPHSVSANFSVEPQSSVLSLTKVPGPSPLLLFAMGGLGVCCVIVNERRAKK